MLTNTRRLAIEWGDCDAAGIVFYPRYFAMFDASTAYLLEKAIGMNIIIFACIGSAGCGFSLAVTNIEIAYSTGRMNQGSGWVRSVIQPIHGAPRISTDACST